jgi:hypothetical protein
MDRFINHIFSTLFPLTISLRTEKILKNFALLLGILSALAIIFDWYPLAMFFSFHSA